MKLTSDSETLAENKVLILYVLSCSSKPMANDALYSIVQTAIDLNYFYFKQFLLDLIDSGYVTSFEKETETFYEITPDGQSTLDLTSDILPGIIKLKVDTNFQNNVENIQNAESIVAEFTPVNQNKFEVECKIIENGETLFNIKTFAYSPEQAQGIVSNWKNNANTLYPKLLGLLTDSSK